MYDRDYLVRVQNVTKRYGDLKAVNNMTLDIRPGEIFALLGPNGAGKTTLIGCITGLITGFEGSIDIAGFDVVKDYQTTRRLLGLVPQELNYDAFFNVRQVLEFQAGYFGVKPTRDRIDDLLKQFSLFDKADANTRWLSGGMKRRLMICKALLHNPALIFLDEPTAGVDVDLRDELWKYVEVLRAQGTTIVLTTHYLEEAEQLADRIGIINQGRLLRVDAKEALMEEFGHRHLDITLTKPDAARWIHALSDLHLDLLNDHSFRFHYQNADHDSPHVDALIRRLIDGDATIHNLSGGRSSLEEIFRRVLKEDTHRQEEARR